MREIKFRAWDTEEKIMSCPFGFNKIDGGTAFNVGEDGESFCLDNDGYSEEECIVMQYTGLKDKNGKEIYEGDILISKEWGCFCRVIFEGGGFTLYEGETAYTLSTNFLDAYGYPITDIEVVGNIYENPELLTE